MTWLLKANFDKLLFGLAVLAAGASAFWLGERQRDIRRLRALPVAAVPAGARYEATSLRLPESQAAVWPKAPAQSHGHGWLYEVFTPPVIYYHPLARSFTVTPPVPPEVISTPFGLELLAVRPEPFRLQLVGYFGAPGDYLAAFVSPGRPGTLLAREGRRFEDLGLTLRSFAVKKIPVKHTDAWPVHDVAGLAVLADDQTGGEVVLDSRAQKFTDTPLAVLQSVAGGPPREVHEGDTYTGEDSTYRIERISVDPPEVVVARTMSGLPQPETRILHPVSRAGGLSAKTVHPKPLAERPARTLVTSGN